MKNYRPLFSSLFAFTGLTCTNVSHADIGKDIDFSVRGFGTLGIVHSDEDRADFADIIAPDGAGYTRAWSAEVDSRLGLQVSAQLTPRLSAVLQVISEQQYDNSFDPEVEWANLKYQFTPDFSVRLGRIIQPTFLHADTRKVGYTYPWVRPPYELYSMSPVTNSDGIDMSYRLHFGEVINTLGFLYGEIDVRLPDRVGGGTGSGEDIAAFRNTLEYGQLTAIITYQRVNLELPVFDPLMDAFRQFGPQGAVIADRYDPNRRVTFFGMGINYDPGKWFLVSEWGKVHFDSLLGDREGGYVSAGVRRGNVTPYVSYAHVNTTTENSTPGLATSGLPPQFAAVAAQLNAGLNATLTAHPGQSTQTIGIRWDFMPDVALKFQYEHINLEAGSPGLFINPQPGFEPGGSADLFSASIDFIF